MSTALVRWQDRPLAAAIEMERRACDRQLDSLMFTYCTDIVPISTRHNFLFCCLINPSPSSTHVRYLRRIVA